MNKDNILAVAKLIDALPEHLYDPGSFAEPNVKKPRNGPAADIAGWAVAWAIDAKPEAKYEFDNTYAVLQELFDVPAEQINRLISPYCNPYASALVTRDKHRYITKERAVRQLRYFVEDGEVDWSATT